MKQFLYLTILAIMGLSSCSSQKKLQTNPPFTIDGPTCQKWTGGMESSGSGLEVRIPLTNLETESIIMQQLYFRGDSTDISTETVNGQRFAIGRFSNGSLKKPDIIMHADPKKEFGNQPPKLKTGEKAAFPFELKNDEAVISYMIGDGKTMRYTKISGIKDLQPLIYSSKPKN